MTSSSSAASSTVHVIGPTCESTPNPGPTTFSGGWDGKAACPWPWRPRGCAARFLNTDSTRANSTSSVGIGLRGPWRSRRPPVSWAVATTGTIRRSQCQLGIRTVTQTGRYVRFHDIHVQAPWHDHVFGAESPWVAARVRQNFCSTSEQVARLLDTGQVEFSGLRPVIGRQHRDGSPVGVVARHPQFHGIGGPLILRGQHVVQGQERA